MNNIDLILETTRVKKYKSYRLEIKKEALAFNKKIEEKDELKLIEKKLKKIDPKLIIKNKDPKFFMDVVVNETNDHGYIKEASFLITSIKNNKFQEILKKTENFEDDIENDPSFDKKGNITADWLKDTDIYNQLLELKEWNNFITNNSDTIKVNIQEKIFAFKDALYKTQNPNYVKNVYPNTIRQTKILKNKNNKKVFFILVSFFSFFILLTIIFLILFLTGA